jgi:methylated-DNA-[protein]-cysteine S-methyltransferase
MPTSVTQWKSPLGIIQIEVSDKGVRKIFFTNKKIDQEKPSAIAQKVITQLSEHFSGKRTSFDVPLDVDGTDFQKAVWNATAQIPFGETVSYGDVAKRIGKPLASRAVGSALGKNQIGIVIPCHRVLASDGSLGGFAWGLECKKQLLFVENIHA